MKKQVFVYLIVNLINQKKYIGSHSTFDLHDGYIGSGIAITKAVQKYGKENFQKVLLEFTTLDKQFITEQKWLDIFQPVGKNDWYNLSSKAIGGNTRSGYTVKQKKSYIQKLIDSLSAIGKVGKKNHMFGKRHTIEFKQLRSKQQKEYFRKRKLLPEWKEQKERMRLAAKQNSLKAALKNSKPIHLKSPSGNICIFKSYTDCAKELKLPVNLVREFKNGKRLAYNSKYSWLNNWEIPSQLVHS